MPMSCRGTKHGGRVASHRVCQHIKWVDSETVTRDNVSELLGDVNGILVPGGLAAAALREITAIEYARTHNILFLGLCLGMQLSIVEYARHVLKYTDAHSIELDPKTTHLVIDLMPDQNGVEDIGGTTASAPTPVF